MANGWVYIDRQVEQQRVQQHVTSGGCVVLLADSEAAPERTLDLFEDVLQRSGRQTIRITNDSRTPFSLTELLRRGIDHLVAPQLGVVPGHLAGAGYLSSRDLSQMIIGLAAGRNLAILIDEIDRDRPLRPADVHELDRLGHITLAPVIVSARIPSQTDWKAVLPRERRLRLGQFTTNQVADAIRLAPPGIGAAQAVALAQTISGPTGRVRPVDAYDLLERLYRP